MIQFQVTDHEDAGDPFGIEAMRPRRNEALHHYLRNGGSMADLARARMEKNAERVGAAIPGLIK